MNDPNCQLSQWSEWTPCTRSCGPEKRTRDRKFRPKKRRKECRAKHSNISLQQTLSCKNPVCESEENKGGEGGGEEEATSEQETFSPDRSEEQTVRGLEINEDTNAGEEDGDLMEAEESVVMRRRLHEVFARGIKRPPKVRRYTFFFFFIQSTFYLKCI